MSDNLEIKPDNQQGMQRFKILGFRSGKTWKKVVASIGYFFIAITIFAMFSGDNDSNTASTQKNTSPIYDLKFDPKVNTVCNDGNITIESDINCPNGAIMQVSLMSADLKEIYNDKPIVKDGKISTTFELTNTDVKNYAGMITFQFNADSIKQPDSVKEVYGQRGEKLEGENAKETNFSDGEKGKNAYITFDVPYPSKEVVESKKDELFNQMANEVISKSNGAIMAIEHPNPGIIHMQVSNAWYLMSENQKQYFAEEMLKNFTQVIKNLDGEENCVFSIVDESQSEVARSKILGGMKIKK